MQQLTRGVHVKLVLFVLVALLGTSYIGARYVGFNPLSSDYEITASLPKAGGLFENSEVTYRGVPVGTVTELTTDADGVTVVAEISGDAPEIPADATVDVRNRSAIGEQYLNLRGGDTDDVLADGAHLAGGGHSLPPDLADTLATARDFVASVPSDDLNTVIDESYELSQGVGTDLSRLLRTSMDFQKAADANFLVSASLIRNSEQVLQTQEESATAIRAYSNDLALFSRTLADSDRDLRTLIANTPGAMAEWTKLIRSVGRPLGTLMTNLVTTATVFGVHSAGVEDTMIRLPEAVSIGWSINRSQGLNMGLLPTFFNPLPCVEGYGGTDKRQGTVTSTGKPFNKSAGCTAPRREGNIRGPQAISGGGSQRPAGTSARITVTDDLGDLLGGAQ